MFRILDAERIWERRGGNKKETTEALLNDPFWLSHAVPYPQLNSHSLHFSLNAIYNTFLSPYIRQRMVQVHIYYETLDTEITEEKPAYDLNDFGCK